MLKFKTLPHQETFIRSTDNTILVGGFGSGKSEAGVIKTIIKKLNYPKYKVAYYLPSYPLIRDIAFGKFTEMLESLNIQYKLNRSDKELFINGYGSIIFRTMSEPDSIVGYEVAYSLIDEADILPQEKMENAYNKILARNRAVDNANVDMVSTPEGFGFLYEKATSDHFKVIKARTTDNKFVPKSYIEQLKEQYTPELLKAYLEGEFVNLTSGTIYKFSREIHHTNRVHTTESIIIGQDFNIGGCVSIVYIIDGMGIYAVDEFESNDTFAVIENIKAKYPNIETEIIPDASGRAGKTNASKSDIQMFRDEGFRVNAPKKNPRVQDRINATNKMLEEKKLFVNTEKCPKFTKALEQQAYKNNEPEKFTGAGTIDDYNDAGTYPIVRLYPVIKPTIKGINISIS